MIRNLKLFCKQFYLLLKLRKNENGGMLNLSKLNRIKKKKLLLSLILKENKNVYTRIRT